MVNLVLLITISISPIHPANVKHFDKFITNLNEIKKATTQIE